MRVEVALFFVVHALFCVFYFFNWTVLSVFIDFRGEKSCPEDGEQEGS